MWYTFGMKRNTKTKTPKKLAVRPQADLGYEEDEMIEATPAETGNKTKKYLYPLLAVIVIIGLVVYKFQYVVIPARVGNQPIYIWQYLSFLHQSYGKGAIQTLTTQALIEQEIVKSKVNVETSAIDKEVDTLDKQASASGGIKAMLTAQQMTLDQLRDQIRIQLAVKEILKDKTAVSDAEVSESYEKNKDFFKGITVQEAQLQVRSQLENQKFQTEAGNWLANIRKETEVKILMPQLQ